MNMRQILYKIWLTFLMILAVTLIAGAAVIYFVNSEAGHAYIIRDNAQRVSKNLTPQKVDQNKKAKTSFDAAKTHSVTAANLWKARQYPAKPIGRMSVPSVDIHNPLFRGFGAQMQNLSYGVCTVLPNRMMGAKNNYVLAGHYMGQYGPAVLDNLHFMQNGDDIYITDLHRIYDYSAYAKSYSVDPHQVQVENNRGKRRIVTLITCSDFNIQKYGFGGHRTVVQGRLKNIYPATQANLIKYELSDHVAHSKARPSVKPKASQFYKNMDLNQIEAIGASIYLLLIILFAVQIWKTPKAHRTLD